MTNLKETNMIGRDEIAGSNLRRMMWVIVSGLGIVMTAGAVAGYLAAHEAQGGGALGTAGILTLCGFAAIIIGLAFAIWRNVSKMKASNEGLTRREKLNRNMIYGFVLVTNIDNVMRLFISRYFADSHPLITILGVIAGIPVFGILGLVFGPLLISWFLLLTRILIKSETKVGA